MMYGFSTFLVHSDHDDHDDHDDHGHGKPCYCKAAEHGWSIDCTEATTIVSGAISYLTDIGNG